MTGFLIFALERLGRDPTQAPFDGPLRRGLDFLLALHGPDGIKCGLVEAKPWYWGATYEVASHPFDVYALARHANRDGERIPLRTIEKAPSAELAAGQFDQRTTCRPTTFSTSCSRRQ